MDSAIINPRSPPQDQEDGQEIDGDQENTRPQQRIHHQQQHQKRDTSDSRTLELEGEQEVVRIQGDGKDDKSWEHMEDTLAVAELER